MFAPFPGCSLGLRLEEQEASAAQSVQAQVTQVLNSQLEEHLQHFMAERLQAMVAAAVEQQAKRWAQALLPTLVKEGVQAEAASAVGGALRGVVGNLHSACEAATEVDRKSVV